MQKGIINIKLIDRPLFVSSNSNEKMHGNNFGNRRKPTFVIDTFHLMVPFSNQSSLKSIHSAIRVKFNLVHPFGSNGLFPEGNGTRSQVPFCSKASNSCCMAVTQLAS